MGVRLGRLAGSPCQLGAGTIGTIRKTAGVIGVEPSSRITDGVSIKDVATAAIVAVPEVAQKVADPTR